MKPTLEQIKTDESVWPKGASHYIGGFFTKWADGKEFSYINGEWKKHQNQKTLKYYMHSDIHTAIPRPTKAEWVPEVGVECEGFTTTPSGNWKWLKVEPLKETSSGEYACITDGRILRFIDQFRPIKSEREKFIEAVVSVNKAHHWTAKKLAKALYDSGKFKLVETEK